MVRASVEIFMYSIRKVFIFDKALSLNPVFKPFNQVKNEQHGYIFRIFER